MTPAQFRKLTIVQTAALLSKLGHTYSPKPGAKLEGKTFVTYNTIDGKLVKAKDIYALYFKGRVNLSLARARQLSMTKRGVSLADDPQLAYGKTLIAERAIDSASSALDDVLKYTSDSKAKQHAGTANRTLESAAAIIVKLKAILKSGKAPEA